MASAAVPSTVSDVSSEREVVKVNNGNLKELKNACDDALKRHLSRPDLFKQIHTHTDVRLALGWAGVFAAAGTGLYGWKTEFEQSKPLVWLGVSLYFILTTVQTLYAYFVEGDVVFVGKRKTLDKRIVTDKITISTNTTPSSQSRSSPSASSNANCPVYTVAATLVRSSNGGKSLLGKQKTSVSHAYNAWFDTAGVMDVVAFESWLSGVVAGIMKEE